MALSDSVQRYPLLRLLVPYICGILVGDALYAHVDNLLEIAAVVCLATLLCMLCLTATRQSAWRALYGVLVWGVFLSLGTVAYSLSRNDITYDWPVGECVYEARVVDSPKRRARSTQCLVEVNAVADSAGWHAVRRKAFVYMEPVSAADSLLPGDVLCFSGRMRPPRNFSDDLEFDYARYVTMQGASGTVYLPEGKWARVEGGSLTLRERLLRLRHRLRTEYMAPAFSDDALGVLLALTLGDKRLLGEDTREAYTDAGAAHVLALSGLHVSIIYGMLALVFLGRGRRWRRMRWLFELLVLGVLWLFALMVGMSASVVRAVFMCTLSRVARWISKESSPISVLSLAAMVMLLVRPLYLFDVGFQLSFMAMAAILWLEPHLEALFQRCAVHPLLAYPMGIVCMSIAAQLGTFPLALYHFGTFPTYFLLTNLFVIVCVSVIVWLTVVWWGLVLTGISWANGLGALLQMLTQWMNGILASIAQWPHAVLHVAHYNACSVLFTYMLILFLALFFIKKWPRGFVMSLASLLGLQVSLLF